MADAGVRLWMRAWRWYFRRWAFRTCRRWSFRVSRKGSQAKVVLIVDGLHV